MSSTPLVSIVTPVFNEERFLPTMLASLQAQTYDSWELLLVDDGSTDGTAGVIEDWAARDERIKAVSVGTKLGKVAAFNAAFAASSGDLLCHVGGDDLLPEGSLAARVQGLSGAPDKAVIFGKLQMVDMHGRTISRPFPRGSKGSQSSAGSTYSRRLADLLFPIPTALPSEDIWLGNGALALAQEVRHSVESIYLYRIHGGNSNPRHKTFRQMSDAMHSRAQALSLLAESDLPLTEETRKWLTVRARAEDMRYDGARFTLMKERSLHPIDRLALLSMSHPALWRVRQRLGVAVTGWRGR